MAEKNEFVVRYTNKDIMNKLEELKEDIGEVHTQASSTNGKVKMHTKLIWGTYGFTFAVMMILISHVTII